MYNPPILKPEDIIDYNKINKQLDIAKSSLFFGSTAAFFAPLMCTLDFQWTNSPECPTAATDGKTFWWNINDFIRCCDKERKSTIMHELWHIARLHPLRRGTRCPDIWNIACDIVINRELAKDNFFLGPDWVHRPDITLEMEEDIYDLLIQPGQPTSPNHTCSNSNITLTTQQGQKMVNATVKAIQHAVMTNKAGDIPGGVQGIVSKYLAPVVPWEVKLQRWMTDLLDEDYSWKRPNRRYNDMYLPSLLDDEGKLAHLAYYWDVSGSIGPDDEIRFNSEVKYIKERFKPKKLTLIQFDTRITSVTEFNENDPFNDIKIYGRGGTNLEPVRQHIFETEPTAAIIFTDLYCSPIGEGIKCPLLWVVVNNPTATVPYGDIIHINPN